MPTVPLKLLELGLKNLNTVERQLDDNQLIQNKNLWTISTKPQDNKLDESMVFSLNISQEEMKNLILLLVPLKFSLTY